MLIALATPRSATSFAAGLEKMEWLLAAASEAAADIICFPEAYVPGLRGVGLDVLPFDQSQHDLLLRRVSEWAQRYSIATIVGTERLVPTGRQIAAWVIDAKGKTLGVQTKNQLDPSEDPFYVPGAERRLFEVAGVKFGVVLCHEGWRYPETVRWAAVRGAKIVFQPFHAGSDRGGVVPTQWGATDGAYYEKAMMCRALENTIYFASVNYCLRYQEAATSLIDPSGRCQAYLPYGEEGVLVQPIDPARATGLLAHRFAPERY